MRDIHIKQPEASFVCRAAALIIKDSKLLVAKNAQYPLYYTIGGAVEINETSQEAAVREVYEELGLQMEIDKLAFVQERFYTVGEQKHHEIVFFYLMKPGSDISISAGTITDQAQESLHWLPLDELGKFNLVPEFLKTKSFGSITHVQHIISRDDTPMTIKAIGFDIGNTLINYPHPLSWKSLYPAALSKVMSDCRFDESSTRIALASAVLSKYNTRENYREYEVTSDIIFKEIFDAWGQNYGKLTIAKESFYGFFQADAVCFHDTIETLDALRAMGIRMGFITDVAYAMDNKYALKDIAEIQHYFDVGVTSTDLGFRKPHAAGYNALLEVFGVPAEQVMYVGDEEKDIVGANSAGMVSVLINRDNEVKNWGQKYTIRNLSEIIDIISCGSWNYVNTQQDIDFLFKQTIGFHDSVLKKLDYISGSYVNDKKQMHCMDSLRQVSMWFDSQMCRPIEMVFESVVALNLRPYSENETSNLYDASLFIENETLFFFDSRIDAIDRDYGGTWIEAYGLRWRFCDTQPTKAHIAINV